MELGALLGFDCRRWRQVGHVTFVYNLRLTRSAIKPFRISWSWVDSSSGSLVIKAAIFCEGESTGMYDLAFSIKYCLFFAAGDSGDTRRILWTKKLGTSFSGIILLPPMEASNMVFPLVCSTRIGFHKDTLFEGTGLFK